jgi:hypothetical protein
MAFRQAKAHKQARIREQPLPVWALARIYFITKGYPLQDKPQHLR